MKKIGIITYHFAKNYGAVLQCYALQQYLINKGYDVKVIDYQTELQKNNNSLFNKRSGIKNIILNMVLYPFKKKRIIKDNRFNEFCKNKLKCTRRIENISELKKLIDEEQFDVVISGSDQVWNPNILDYNEAFLFPIETRAKKVSYAASVGNINIEGLNNIKTSIKQFNNISVRERKTAEKLQKIIDNKICVVPDPVILVDKQNWIENFKLDGICDEKYVLCYFLNKENFSRYYKIVNKIAKKENLKIKIVNARFSINSFKKGTIIDAGPEEFVSLISKAEFICTDSFHGTVFSTIFNKRFISFEKEKNGADTRKTDYLRDLGLQDNIVYINDDYTYNENDVDYDIVNKKIIELKNCGKEFLEVSLK